MVRIVAMIGGIGLGCLVGYMMRHVPLAPYWQSLGALMAGWVLASSTLALSWLLWPPADIEILAVSVGIHEAALAAVTMLAFGAVLHPLLTWSGAALHPNLLVYRTALMGFVGGVVGAASFSMGVGGMHPLT